MSYKLDEIGAVAPAYCKALATVGIRTTDDLIKLCATAAERQDISDRIDTSAAQLLKWADLADLMRIKGVGRQFAGWLTEASIDTVKKLRTQTATDVLPRLATVNAKHAPERRLPTEDEVQGWIDAAMQTQPKIDR